MVSKDLGPELSELVTIANFNDMILLHHFRIELQLFFFELGQRCASNIDCKEVSELSLRYKFPLISLHSVLHASYIILILEHGRHSFLSCCNIFYVRPGLVKFFYLFGVRVDCILVAIKRTFERFQIIEFALDPMI